jgi:hypothetical protein
MAPGGVLLCEQSVVCRLIYEAHQTGWHCASQKNVKIHIRDLAVNPYTKDKNNPDEGLRGILGVWQDHFSIEAADRQELVHEAQCPAKAALVGHAWQLVVRRDG